MVACFISDRQKRMMIFKILLEHGADPVLIDVHGRNCIMYACAMRLKREVEMLIRDCDYDLNAADIYGDTMLHVCARTGDTKVLGLVLREMQRYKKNISPQNNCYLTPLSLAIMNGHSEAAKILHQAGGHPRFSTRGFNHILYMLREHQKELRESGVRAIADASSVGQAFEAKSYLLKGAEVMKCRPPSKIHFASRRREGNEFLPRIETAVGGDGLLYCPLISDSQTFNVPQLPDICRVENKTTGHYYY